MKSSSSKASVEETRLCTELIKCVEQGEYQTLAGDKAFNCLLNSAAYYASSSPPEFRNFLHTNVGEVFSNMLNGHVNNGFVSASVNPNKYVQ